MQTFVPDRFYWIEFERDSMLDVKLYDDNNQIIDLNGMDWSLTLRKAPKCK